MDFFIAPALAQAAGPASPGSAFSPLIMMGVVFLIRWFFMIRPQMKRAKEHRSLIDSLATGDEVLTNGGILGRIAAIEDSLVSLEIARGVEVRVQKQAISAVMPKGTLK